MDHFFQYFFQDIGRLFRAFLDIFSSIFSFLNYLLNFPMRIKIISEYDGEFSTKEWIMLVVVNLVLAVIIVLLAIWLVKKLKKLLRFRVPVQKYDDMERQVKTLQRDLLQANYEKDKLLNRLVADVGSGVLTELGMGQGGAEEQPEQGEYVSGNRNTTASPCVDPAESRFFRLTSVDNFYKTGYQQPEYDENITLSEFIDRFRLFAASQLGLFYSKNVLRYFVASMGACRIMILQGISGTGKTSLPYAFGKFIQNDAAVCSVQPSWRERSELYGYFNEFTKKYTETEFLRAVYEANYRNDPQIVILDEMNIARVEYYFAEMLSILELPNVNEQVIDVVNDVWDNDPCLIKEGKIQIPTNVWFVGTINNDDSTFAVADKVYDRAIPIDLDSRAVPFDEGTADAVHVKASHLQAMFDEAMGKYPVSQEMLDKIDDLNEYLIKHFRLSIGNRIVKQIHLFVPCYVACGGTELEAVDFMVQEKVLRKFESLSLGFLKDELVKFNTYLDKTFGKNGMPLSKEYVDSLRRNS